MSTTTSKTSKNPTGKCSVRPLVSPFPDSKIISSLTEQVVVSVEEERSLLRKTEFDNPVLDKIVARAQQNAKILNKIK